jgi:hypothetical protein
LEAVGELFVIEAEQVEHRRVQIGDGDAVFDSGVAELKGIFCPWLRLKAAARRSG